jgi:hypothetical protein
MAPEVIQLKKRMPIDHAELAYRDGYYVEAIQILHANLEISLRIFLLLIRKENSADSHEIEDLLDEFNYPRCSKILFILGYINKDMFDRLMEFHKWKNFIIDKLLLPMYKANTTRIIKQQYDAAFHAGIYLNQEIIHILETTHQHLV